METCFIINETIMYFRWWRMQPGVCIYSNPSLKDTPLERTQILTIKYCDYNVMLPLTKAHLSNKDELFGRSDLPITGGPL